MVVEDDLPCSEPVTDLVGEWAYISNGGYVPLDLCGDVARELREFEQVLRDDPDWLSSDDSGWVLDLIDRLGRLFNAAIKVRTAVYWT